MKRSPRSWSLEEVVNRTSSINWIFVSCTFCGYSNNRCVCVIACGLVFKLLTRLVMIFKFIVGNIQLRSVVHGYETSGVLGMCSGLR